MAYISTRHRRFKSPPPWTLGNRDSSVVRCRTRDRKVAGSSPGRRGQTASSKKTKQKNKNKKTSLSSSSLDQNNSRRTVRHSYRIIWVSCFPLSVETEICPAFPYGQDWDLPWFPLSSGFWNLSWFPHWCTTDTKVNGSTLLKTYS